MELKELNYAVLVIISEIIKRSMDTLIHEDNNEMFIVPKELEELKDYNDVVNGILTNKLRKKFGV